MKYLTHAFAFALALIAATPATTAAATTTTAATDNATPAWPGDEGREAYEKLGAFYADKNRTNPHAWDDAWNALEQLDSPDAAVSERAGKLLAAFFAQSYADLTYGRPQTQFYVAFGRRANGEEGAWTFHNILSEDFGRDANSPAAMPAVRWLLEAETDPNIQPRGMTVLCRIHTPEADALLLKQLATPHPNPAVLIAAINEAANRQLGASVDSLAKLCAHPYAAVREAARNAYALLAGGKTPPPYDPAAAFSPDLAATLLDIVRMAPPVPPDATWHLFTKKPFEKQSWTKWPLRNPDEEPKTFSGWLCSETETDFVVIDYFAQSLTLPKSKWTATPETLAQTVQRLLDVRAKLLNPDDVPLSRGGNLTGQFESAAICAPEMLTAAWLFARDERAECAKLLFPRLEALRNDRALRPIALAEIGRVYNENMLEAFSYRRDYAATLALARRLSDPVFDGYAYHGLAIDLAAQLARTTDDFRTLTLPTADEWTRLRATMSREEIIRYLAARLRLINSIQRMQPMGGVNYAEPQYRTPWVGEVPEDKPAKVINPSTELLAVKLTANDLKLLFPSLEAPENRRVQLINPSNELLAMKPAADDSKSLLPHLEALENKRVELISPSKELLAMKLAAPDLKLPLPFLEEPDDKRVQVINPFNELLAMKLTATDLKLLLPYLAQRDFIPAFSFWRDFHPARTLHQVDWVVGEIINQVAQRDLASMQKLDALGETERAARIAEITRWCDEHAALSSAALVLDSMRTAADDTQWIYATHQSVLCKLGDEAAEIISARASEFPKISARTAEALYYLRNEKALPLARQWLAHADHDTRFWSALLVLSMDKGAPKEEAFQVLEKILTRKGDDEEPAPKGPPRFENGKIVGEDNRHDPMRNVNLYPPAIDPLLSCGMPGAEKLALGILQESYFSTFLWPPTRIAVLHRFLLAGCDEAYAFVQEKLDDGHIYTERAGQWEGQPVTRKIHVFDEIARLAGDWRKDWKYPESAPDDLRKQKVAELKTWLAQQQEKIKRGEPSELVQVPKPLPGWWVAPTEEDAP